MRAIVFWSLRGLGLMILWLLSGNGFHIQGHCDLVFGFTDHKNNNVLQLNKCNHPLKFESWGSNSSWGIERKRNVTDRQTDRAKKQYVSLWRRHNYLVIRHMSDVFTNWKNLYFKMQFAKNCNILPCKSVYKYKETK